MCSTFISLISYCGPPSSSSRDRGRLRLLISEKAAMSSDAKLCMCSRSRTLILLGRACRASPMGLVAAALCICVGEAPFCEGGDTLLAPKGGLGGCCSAPDCNGVRACGIVWLPEEVGASGAVADIGVSDRRGVLSCFVEDGGLRLCACGGASRYVYWEWLAGCPKKEVTASRTTEPILNHRSLLSRVSAYVCEISIMLVVPKVRSGAGC